MTQTFPSPSILATLAAARRIFCLIAVILVRRVAATATAEPRTALQCARWLQAPLCAVIGELSLEIARAENSGADEDTISRARGLLANLITLTLILQSLIRRIERALPVALLRVPQRHIGLWEQDIFSVTDYLDTS